MTVIQKNIPTFASLQQHYYIVVAFDYNFVSPINMKVMAEYTTITENWKRLSNNLPYKWIVDYASYNAYGNFELSSDDWEKRDYIVNFKGNSELTTEIDHQQALSKAIIDISSLIIETFGKEARKLTFVCIPASTQANTKRRFEEFSQKVCEKTGMTNAYPLITWTSKLNPDDGEQEDEYTFDANALRGKDILLFDDIIASGGSICRFAEKTKAMGANVVAAIALGKKV